MHSGVYLAKLSPALPGSIRLSNLARPVITRTQSLVAAVSFILFSFR